MDPNAAAAAAAAAPTGLDAWLAANGAMLQLWMYAAQFLYWIAMIIFIGYAVATYKRWVNFQMGVGHSGKLRTGAVDSVEADSSDSFDAKADDSKDAISVEEFVD